MNYILPPLFGLSAIVALIAGWISNLVWLFNQSPLQLNGETVIAALGVVMAPVGAIHGIYTWF